MSASVYSLEEIATQLHQAARTQKPIAQISTQQELSIDQAYEVQRLLLQHRYQEGEKLIGLKMGFTSEAKMQQMGVNDFIWGRLTDAMFIENAGSAQEVPISTPAWNRKFAFESPKTSQES